MASQLTGSLAFQIISTIHSQNHTFHCQQPRYHLSSIKLTDRMTRGDLQILFFTALVSTAALVLLAHVASAQGGECSTNDPCPAPNCCSQYGYCGSGSAYCGVGCTGGPCTTPSAPPTPPPPTQCSGTKACAVRTNCCSQDGYCGTSIAFCGAGCTNGPCRAHVSGETGWSCLTEALFDQLFPNRTLPLYSYANLQKAHHAFPALGTTGTLDTQKREVAAFLANVAHESIGLKYAEEIDQSDSYCDTTNTQYPCAPGKKYFGRGALQLSWNYNYGACGAALKLPLLANPDIVAQNGVIAFESADWFWMADSNCHNAILGGSFSGTIRGLNGAIECNQPVGSVGYNAMLNRVMYYQNFCSVLGVNPGTDLQC